MSAIHSEQILKAVAHAAHLLPAQGPITVFVHHNTLHAFEGEPFLQAVARGARVFGCDAFLSEDEYRQELAVRRIRLADIEAALIDDLQEKDDELIGALGTRFALRYAMLEHPVHQAPEPELKWLVAETDALRIFRPEVDSATKSRMVRLTHRWILRELGNGPGRMDPRIEATVRQLLHRFHPGPFADWNESIWESFTLHLLWRACQHGVHGLRRPPRTPPDHLRHRDVLWQAGGSDSDLVVHELLIRFCAAFLDQGFAQWGLPERERGFFGSFLDLYRGRGPAPHPALRGLGRELEALRRRDIAPLESIRESLTDLGVQASELESFLSATLLALRGWAGMIHQVETRGDRVPHGIPSQSLVGFLAVRLVLERVVLTNLVREFLGVAMPLAEFRAHLARHPLPAEGVEDFDRAFPVFQIAQVRGWTPEVLFHLTKPHWEKLVHEIESFSEWERRKVFQLAFERAYRNQALTALAMHTRQHWLQRWEGVDRMGGPPSVPSFQAICCIDDREESFRRHLEETDPQCETLGAAGFFAAPMYFRGVADAHFVPLCPIIMQPRHYVAEQVAPGGQDVAGRQLKLRRSLGRQVHALHNVSRTFLGGLATAILGPLATIPLVMRVLFPRATAQARRRLGTIVLPPRETQLTLERGRAAPGKQEGELGFQVPEMADCVERLLRDTGLTHQFARVIVVFGHGSSSLNNPHESAYNCGACGGGRGGPNARAVAAMGNHPSVRRILADRGLSLPTDTVFVGGYHNTCDDSVTYFDEEAIPTSHREDFVRLQGVVDRALEVNAHERCRRFVSAELSLKPAAARTHVQERSEDLSQTRPEYNHATNAMCLVGRRSRTRGLFLDRRCFLVSYDPTQDDDQSSILTRILQAVVPVCAGINLEYYFSRVDVGGYGCGSKLPHNVTSLLGVMDGAASDLRTGLSAQMVEIHDPVRLLFVLEATPDTLMRILANQPAIQQLCGNGWVQVAALDPCSDAIHLLRGDRFVRFRGAFEELPLVRRSSDWYRGWRHNLGFACVSAGLPPVPTAR